MTESSPAVVSFHDAVARRAESRPDGALVGLAGCPRWTAAALWQRSMAISGGLRAILGTGDVVATCLPPGPEAIAVTTAISALAAVEMPLGTDVDEGWALLLAESAGCVTTLSSTEAFLGSPHLTRLGRHRTVPAVSLDGSCPGAVPLDELVAFGRPVEPRLSEPGAPALMMTTSGTTGRRKAALVPVGAGIGQATRVLRAMRYDESDVLYNCFSWQHINARHAAFLPAVLGGAQLVLDTRFSASRFVDIVRAEGATAFNFMGAVCAMLLRQTPSERDQEHLVRRAYGGPAPVWLADAMRERFGITLLQAYACTELGDVATTHVTDVRPGSAGRPVPEYQLRVVDGHDSDVPPGDVGELLVRPQRPNLAFVEYVGDPAATARAWHDGWFRTGDQVRLDDGWLYVEGRSADVVRRRGVNISPEAVEAVIATMHGVAEVAVVGIPSELTDDEVLAVVVANADHIIDPSDVRHHCIGRLPRHALPRFVSIQSSLPRTANHKVSRAELRKCGLPAGVWDAESSVGSRTESEVS